jgi:flagellar hook-associated protein 1 FlgK
MASSILSVGQSALAAAQIGLTTTGHNIANANTAGYSRQVVVQGSAGSQDDGFGFVGKGTQVAEVRRVFNEFLNNRVSASQSSTKELQTYYSQISQINNQFADSTAGLAPVLQDFFSGLQELSSNASSASARQTALSNAETLASRVNSLDSQLRDMAESVNGQVTSSITTINSYAKQLARLNDEIEKAQGVQGGKPSNDLLDQRDFLVTELSKEIKTTVVKQGASYSIFIGNGQPLVVGVKTFDLAPARSTTDTSRIGVGYVNNGQVVPLDEGNLTGGNLGGLLSFRSKTLDTVRNSLGQIAVGLAASFNAQHALGQDLNNQMGGDFFKIGAPETAGHRNNTGTDKVSTAITDASKITNSNYRLERDADSGAYRLTRLSDNARLYEGADFPDGEYDGLTFTSDSGAFANGNEYLIKPTAGAAAGFSVAITDPAKIAAASPVIGSADIGNEGSGKISTPVVNGPAPVDANLREKVTITFTSATTFDVTGIGDGLPMTGQTYTEGQDLTVNGWTVKLSGKPAPDDVFTVGPNNGGVRDNTNALQLAGLQKANTLNNGTMTLQDSYSALVSLVGNKARELEVTSKAEATSLTNAYAAQQAESGVNLDEEATNLLRYQQAYQAAGKVMQTASQLFELLLSLGN